MSVFFWIFVGLCAYSVLAMVVKPERLLEYPYLIGLTFGTFILPQVYGVAMENLGTDEMLESLSLMACLCIGCAWAGYWLGRGRAVAKVFRKLELDEGRLLHCGVAFVLVGGASSVLIGQLGDEANALHGGQWSGTITKYVFFSRLGLPGFLMCLIVALKTGRSLAWMGAAVGAAFPLYAILFFGRREQAAHIVLALLAAMWYFKGARIPRIAIVGALAFGLLVVPNIGKYRGIAANDPLGALTVFDPRERWSEGRVDEIGPNEVGNAMYLIAATRTRGDYRYGQGYWNNLVFQYVPAQFVGVENKEKLYLGVFAKEDTSTALVEDFGYVATTGSTVTCLGDAFRELGYMGAAFFLAQGWLMRGFHRVAGVSIAGFLFLVPLLVASMTSVTHQTVNFPTTLIYYALFLSPCLYYAGTRRRREQDRPEESTPASRMKPLRAPGAAARLW